MGIIDRKQSAKYIISDFVMANIAWLLLNMYRYDLIGIIAFPTLTRYLLSGQILLGQLFIPVGWILLYYYSGYYNLNFNRYRLQEISTTIHSVCIGILGIFFLVVINDLPRDYHIYYELLGFLFATQFGLTYLSRRAISYFFVNKLVRQGKNVKKPSIEIISDRMSEGEKNIKHTWDKLTALLCLLLLSPLLAYLAFRVKRETPGGIIYRQERLGYRAKPFMMYKFRTMQENAERGIPQLCSETDDRVTSFGHLMRKYRLDELPQFWNVLKGDMSLVGPRPERDYFAKQILEQAPEYERIYSVRPGITSWGMVKYGYANTVEKMTERMKLDLVYLDNRSLIVDLKILIYTVKTILTGKGV